MINVVIEGGEHSGKSQALALIGRHLRELGLDVVIQSESSHNAPFLAMSNDELVEYLSNTRIILTALRTT